MAEKLTSQEAYELHLKAWKEAGIKIDKAELDDLQRIYKVGRYTPKRKIK